MDENIDPEVVDVLAARDVTAEDVPGALFAGADDFEDILPYCRRTGAVLVTNNVRDFIEAALPPSENPGIVIVHDKERPAVEIADELTRLASAYQDRDEFSGFERADDWTSGP